MYLDGHQGIPNWEEDELIELTRKANDKGLKMHIHAMGNKGVNRVINAYVDGGKEEMRNTLVHVYGVIPSDYKRMADHNIHVSANFIWRHVDNDLQADLLKTFLDEQRESIRRAFLLAADSLGTEKSFLNDLFICRRNFRAIRRDLTAEEYL